MKPSLIGLIVAAHVAAIIPASATVSQATLDNLNTAFQGESNAAHRYEAFAQKAAAEGHSQVARLFRAAARAESIHRENHKQAILALGGQVKSFKLDEVNAGTTAENLRAAIAGETYERDKMYPSFLKQSREDTAGEATRTLIYARKAEAEHARLYQETLANLGRQTEAPLYVCKVCGYTTTRLPDSKCPSCRKPVGEYVAID